MEVGGEGDYNYTYRYTVIPVPNKPYGFCGRQAPRLPFFHTVTTRMIPALRWAAMRAILMFQ